ncbi:GNAT family N-acetyltransferase [Halomonas mongoliensis]|uniref:GNAT family N-acetyltransferase n=1 Tax=Halomonas mongoliensis TaxID=321265 RepID=UPI00403AA487
MTFYDPLFHPGWIEFNKIYWGLNAEVLEFGPKKGTAWELKTVAYTNKKGLLVNPPRNPHIPVEFLSSSDKPSSYNRRKRLAIQELASYYARRKVKGGINLSPIVNDVRPFLWSGMEATPRFTFHINPHCYRQYIDSRTAKKSRKAIAAGYKCDITTDLDAVVSCLGESESRNDFDHQVSKEGLAILRDKMGDNFVCFLAYDVDEKPAGARVTFYADGGMVMAWSAGVRTAALKDGVNNLLGEFVLDHFSARNCQIFDFVGANIPPVAEMKEAWGGELVCYYTIRQQSLRNLARSAYFMAKNYLNK